eukprot:SAG31_NODE_13237_length_883_cov_1.198980_2_plen_62_part_01
MHSLHLNSKTGDFAAGDSTFAVTPDPEPFAAEELAVAPLGDAPLGDAPLGDAPLGDAPLGDP